MIGERRRMRSGGKNGRATKRRKNDEDAIAAAVEEKVEAKLQSMKQKEQNKKKTDEEARSYIMSLFPEAESDVKLPPKPPVTTSNANASAVQKVNKVTLQSILRKAKN